MNSRRRKISKRGRAKRKGREAALHVYHGDHHRRLGGLLRPVALKTAEAAGRKQPQICTLSLYYLGVVQKQQTTTPKSRHVHGHGHCCSARIINSCQIDCLEVKGWVYFIIYWLMMPLGRVCLFWTLEHTRRRQVSPLSTAIIYQNLVGVAGKYNTCNSNAFCSQSCVEVIIRRVGV